MPLRAPFIAAIEHTESGGRNDVPDSPKGAIGPMQVMPETGAGLGYSEEDLRNPTTNRQAGAQYLEQLSQRYNGNEYLIAAAYNAGPGRVDQWLAGQKPLPPETRDYVPKVMGFLNSSNGGMRTADDAQASYMSSRDRRADAALGTALMSQNPPQEEEAQPGEVQTGSEQPAQPGGIPPMTFTMRGGPRSPGAPQIEAPKTDWLSMIQQWGREHGLEADTSDTPEEQQRKLAGMAEHIVSAMGGIGGGGGEGPTELPETTTEGSSTAEQRPIVPPSSGEVPHKILTMHEAAAATPMDEQTFNGIQIIGEADHALIKQPIDAMDLLRMHAYGIDKARDFMAAAQTATQTGNAADMVHAALLRNELADIVAPRWEAAWHQMGLGLRMGRELKPESDTMRDLTELMKQDNDLGGLLHAAAQLPTPEARAELFRQAAAGARQNLASNLLSYYVESLLSFNTVAKKIATDAWLATWQVPERWTAEQISRVARFVGAAPENTVAPGEAHALIVGLKEAAPHAAALAKQALVEDKSPLNPDVWGPVGWGDASRSSANISTGTPLEDTLLGAGLDLWGQFIHLPARGILTTDTFAKAVNQHANLNALIYRKAYWQTAAKGLEGDDFAEAMQEAFDGMRAKPPPALVQQATDIARKNTLAQALDLHPDQRWTLGHTAQGLQDFRAHSPLVRVILPFWPTLVNLARQTMEFSGPLGVLSRSMRDDLMSSGPDRYIAMAKMGLSSLLMTGLWDYLQGSGPKNPVTKELWREEGNQEYSLGSQHHEIGNLPEPISGTIETLADIRDLSARVHPRDAATLGTAAITLLSKHMDDSTALQNLTNLLDLANAGKEEFDKEMAKGEMASEMTPDQQAAQESIDQMQRGSPAQKARRALLKMAGTVVPTTVANLAHAIDPVRRQVNGIVDEIASRTPGWSEKLQPEVNLFGKPALQPMGWNRYIGNQISLFRNTEIKSDPVTAELYKLNPTVPVLGHDEMLTVGSRGAYEKIPVSPDQVTRVNTLRGTMKDSETGLDLHGTLEQQINGDEYQQADAPGRRTILMRVIGQYSRMAVDSMMEGDKDMQNRYLSIRATREKMRSSPGLALGAP